MAISNIVGEVLVMLALLTGQTITVVAILTFVVMLSIWTAFVVDGADKLQSVLKADFGKAYTWLTIIAVILGSCYIAYIWAFAIDGAVDYCAAEEQCSLFVMGVE